MGERSKFGMETAKSKDALCPGCGKAVDPLRAGHVSIDANGFHYFCGIDCKRLYVEVESKRPSVDAVTAEPPSVSLSRPVPVVFPTAAPTTERGRVIDRELRRESPASHVEPIAFPESPEPSLEDVDDDVPLADVAEAPASGASVETSSDRPPETLRSPLQNARISTSREARTPSKRDLAARVDALVIPIGIACGVLSTVVSLAGESGAGASIPLAFVAVIALSVRAVRRERGADEVSPWLVAAPVVVSMALAIVTRFLETRGAHPYVYSVFSGLSAAGALLVEALFVRARRDVVVARDRFASGLDVRVRVVTRPLPDGARGEEQVREVSPVEVKAGEQVLVEAGETIGVDGVIVSGSADVAPWIDSPVVLRKKEGDAVVAGATVLDGRLRLSATFTGNERAWRKLDHPRDGRAHAVAPFVLFTKRVAERGVPVLALIVAATTYVNHGSWLDVLFAVCAGTFVLGAQAAVAASALSHARGHVAAFRRGVVYRDARSFDVAARADLAVVCSRGTVLLGEPEIVVVEATAGRDTSRVLSLAAGAETASTGAVAAAILREARARDVRPENVRSALVHPGLGVTALVTNGEKVIVGSRAFLLKERVSVAVADGRVSELEAQGRSVVLVALGGRLVGLLALQDGLRVGARAAVQRMHDARIEPVLLSGEARETCQTIARALDIEHVRPEVLPADRDAEVRSLVEGGRVIAAIGHPVSDDGALGAADVSVAMGAAGAAPGEWGVALASDDVRDAALALTIPRACRERARVAVIVCAVAQALVLLGIAFGIAPPVLAPMVSVVASVFAISVVREPTTTPPSGPKSG